MAQLCALWQVCRFQQASNCLGTRRNHMIGHSTRVNAALHVARNGLAGPLLARMPSKSADIKIQLLQCAPASTRRQSCRNLFQTPFNHLAEVSPSSNSLFK